MKKTLIALTLIVSSICATSCAQQPKQQKQQAIGGVESSVTKMGDVERIKITADTANIRSGCSNNTPVLQKSNKDNTYDVVNQVSDWFAVKLPDNNIGFVPKAQCKPIVAEDKKPGATPDTSGTTPQGTTAPKTPTTETTSTTLTDSEQKMVNLVNQARSQNNLPPLTVDMQLANVARTKAQDMIDNNYFSHNSPKYGSPFDMMKSFGIKFVQAGENIAGNQSVENAENALMNSPGHRQNILNPNYTHIGIGIKAGGPYGNMFSQMFISKPQ
ncbi:CAP domain-containing protein [Clostridium lundense]|uniref:CAP domain-containing protein n=1 Tax=Clostridium lundense TaxID=319475 RepID=UPI00048A01B5|nr:CAP domain-containing protein [Clostridium lundense]